MKKAFTSFLAAALLLFNQPVMAQTAGQYTNTDGSNSPAVVELCANGVDNISHQCSASNTDPTYGQYTNSDGSTSRSVVLVCPTGTTTVGCAATVASVTGTANQIVVTGTSTPVLSLSSTLVAPGTVAIGAGSPITSSGPGGALGSNAFTSTAYLPLAGGTLTGQVTLNLNATAAPTPITGTILQLAGANGVNSFIENNSFGAAPGLLQRRADGTAASPTAVQSAEVLANLGARPYDGSAYATASTGSLQAVASENFTTGHHGTDIVANCTAITTITTAECGRLKSSGFTIPTGSTYQINGTQIAASDLSNGVTGSGAVMLAASPTTTGTLAAAAATFSSTINVTGLATLQSGFTFGGGGATIAATGAQARLALVATSNNTPGLSIVSAGVGFNASSGVQIAAQITPTITQTSTAGVDILKVAPSVTSSGSGVFNLTHWLAGASGTTEVASLTSAGAFTTIGNVRTNTLFDVNGTDGVTKTCSVIPTGMTITGGIVTAVSGGTCS